MQELKKKILFVCSANKDRSKTAEDYFASITDRYVFESAGTNLKICNKLGTNPLTEELLQWADQIFVMESMHKKFIETQAKQKVSHKIELLNIADVYKYYQVELIQILKQKLNRFLVL